MPLLLPALPLLLALARAGPPAPSPAPPVTAEAGESLGAVTLADLSGRPVRLAAFRGQPAVVFFLKASWCPHCVDLLVQLQELKRGDLAALAVLVVTTEAPETIRRLVAGLETERRVRLTHLFLVDSSLHFASRYRLSAQAPARGWPAYLLLLNRDGRIAWSWSEPHDAAKPVGPGLAETARALAGR